MERKKKSQGDDQDTNEDRTTKTIIVTRNYGIRISLFSTFAIIAVFSIYGYLLSSYNHIILSSKVIQILNDLAIATLVLLVVALSAIGYGIYQISISEKMKIKSNKGINGYTKNHNDNITTRKRFIAANYFTIVVEILSQKKYFRLFTSILFAYAMIFSFVSQIIIFRPDISVSHLYHVIIPSWKITICCNFPGIIPMFTAYISDNLIIFIIPINLILAVVLSTLVGINITLALYLFQKKRETISSTSNTKNKKNLSSCFSGIGGTTTALFTACPICAGTIFSTILGM